MLLAVRTVKEWSVVQTVFQHSHHVGTEDQEAGNPRQQCVQPTNQRSSLSVVTNGEYFPNSRNVLTVQILH